LKEGEKKARKAPMEKVVPNWNICWKVLLPEKGKEKQNEKHSHSCCQRAENSNELSQKNGLSPRGLGVCKRIYRCLRMAERGKDDQHSEERVIREEEQIVRVKAKSEEGKDFSCNERTCKEAENRPIRG